ncbi:DUF4065 domain-containing protein [Haloferax sp. Atlit-19N]|uniref:type II toxin-antitoxin system antitoxin SocA domain-containing protein n=1 Tax=Haloferax sp. Atlit-19N TaxID=2077201 RepID=UPI000E241EA1|nr:type II toxin-antitoxin system antitoxin SocA domain-containing protein [Haloferax sp. Atlit-19N]RDZ42955.1 DUF4065 domain-containing protein [Haloferax sp. Atlit-19N]
MGRIDRVDRRTDVVFILFYFAEEICGVTKIQKLLFLIEQETEFFLEYEDDIAFNFAPYKMGPFSQDVYSELHFLLQLNAIEKSSWDTDTEYIESDLANQRFVITDKGHKIAKELVNILDQSHQQEIQNIVNKYNSLSLNELLEYVYTEYPKYTVNSEIKDEIIGDCS